jgi:hypothetical protein
MDIHQLASESHSSHCPSLTDCCALPYMHRVHSFSHFLMPPAAACIIQHPEPQLTLAFRHSRCTIRPTVWPLLWHSALSSVYQTSHELQLIATQAGPWAAISGTPTALINSLAIGVCHNSSPECIQPVIPRFNVCARSAVTRIAPAHVAILATATCKLPSTARPVHTARYLARCCRDLVLETLCLHLCLHTQTRRSSAGRLQTQQGQVTTAQHKLLQQISERPPPASWPVMAYWKGIVLLGIWANHVNNAGHAGRQDHAEACMPLVV